MLVELDADEAHPQCRACNGGTAQSQEWIGGDADAGHAVQLEAVRRQPPRERGRVRPLLVAALNGVVGQEPGVAAASQARTRLLPPRDVRLVLILHADRPPIDRGLAGPAEMKDELVAVVEKALAVDGLVVADREVVGEAGPRSRQRLLDGDRLDPVNDVLQFEVRPDGLGDVERGPRILRFGADVQKERAVFGQSAPRRLDPVRRPLQILRPRTAVVIRDRYRIPRL